MPPKKTSQKSKTPAVELDAASARLVSENPFLATAPPQCERCNIPLPTPKARVAHVAETGHCLCYWARSGCIMYIPPGSFYGHASSKHPLDPEGCAWNDHMVNAWDIAERWEMLPEKEKKKEEKECARRRAKAKREAASHKRWEEREKKKKEERERKKLERLQVRLVKEEKADEEGEEKVKIKVEQVHDDGVKIEDLPGIPDMVEEDKREIKIKAADFDEDKSEVAMGGGVGDDGDLEGCDAKPGVRILPTRRIAAGRVAKKKHLPGMRQGLRSRIKA
ncbi:hypothetical protein B0H63DRAFT_470996 [Podospora didyma]|uniref:Uncharacterized protein n=1 Tax=Podospora didyma TaxID=330526 RepID=A0AAE0U264_9PEZI|nr:hypothetical protein B0H63DRAFT_470996 [Podospora didyma]